MSKTPIVILVIISILFSQQNFQEPEEAPRIVETEKDVLVFHWQLVEWEGNEVLCKLEIQHEGLPEQSDVLQQCEEGVLEIWQNTPHCENQLSLEGSEPCVGVYVQFIDKEFKTITETVTFEQADVRIEQVICVPGSTCSQNPGVMITAEEPMPEQSIASIHIYDGGKETVCQGDSCFMKITPKDGETQKLEYWAVSSLGDQTQHESFIVRVMEIDLGKLYRFDISGEGIYDYFQNGAVELGLFPTLPGTGLQNYLQPENPDELTSQYNLEILAERLIHNGYVNAEHCPSNGLALEGGVNTCGREAAEMKMLEWQNQYNELIFKTALEEHVPARLIKGVIAQESQFWPVFDHEKEFGLGRVTLNGIDLALSWDLDLFLETCKPEFGDLRCAYGYAEFSPGERDYLIGLVYQRIGTEQEIDLIAKILSASLMQVKQMAENIVLQDLQNVTSFEDMWKYAIANYHAGSGCIGNAMDADWRNHRDIKWETGEKFLSGDCQSAIYYVDKVFDFAKME